MEKVRRMNLTRVKALTKKEFIQVARDYRSLALAIAIPVLLLVLFGFALSLDVDNVPIAIWDQGKTQILRSGSSPVIQKGFNPDSCQNWTGKKKKKNQHTNNDPQDT